MDAIKEILTSQGRTLSQGALAWLWARSGNTIPIPGFRSLQQMEENIKALEFGPLTDAQCDNIDDIMRKP